MRAKNNYCDFQKSVNRNAMGKSEDKKDLTKEVEMNEHTDSIPQVEAQEISFKILKIRSRSIQKF